MSDNVIRPNQWLANAESSLATPSTEPLTPDEPIAGGGGGPHDPGMETRLTAVETDVRDIKSALQRIESLLGKVDDRLRNLESESLPAMAIDLAELKGRIQNLPSTWSMIATVIGGQIALAGMLFGGIRFLSGH
jgi:hypothetical protein